MYKEAVVIIAPVEMYNETEAAVITGPAVMFSVAATIVAVAAAEMYKEVAVVTAPVEMYSEAVAAITAVREVKTHQAAVIGQMINP